MKATARRVLLGSGPALAGAVLTTLVPLSGYFFLNSDDYAFWALTATLSSTLMLMDFGAVSMTNRLASRGLFSRAAFGAGALLTASPALVLSIVPVLIWPLYSAASGLEQPLWLVVTCFTTVGLGTALRSIGNVQAAAALGRGQFAVRSWVLLSGAFCYAAITLTGLVMGGGNFALGFGSLSSGLVQVIVGAALVRTDRLQSEAPEVASTIRSFIRSKGLVTLSNLSVNQLDRWIIGLIASPDLLAVYDVVVRFAAMPKFALNVASASLVSESARVSDDSRATLRLTKGSVRAFTSLSAVGLLFSIGASFVVLGERSAIDSLWLVLMVPLAAACSAVALAPSAIATGAGRPAAELWVAIPSVATAVLAYSLGIATGAPELLVLVMSAGLALSAILFVSLTLSRRRRLTDLFGTA